VHTFKSDKHKSGLQVQISFSISQHSRDSELMQKLVTSFECGVYKERINRKIGEFSVSGLSDISEKLIPFFEKYPIQGIKALNFADFKLVVELMKKKAHLTPEGIDQILNIKSGMNTRRKS